MQCIPYRVPVPPPVIVEIQVRSDDERIELQPSLGSNRQKILQELLEKTDSGWRRVENNVFDKRYNQNVIFEIEFSEADIRLRAHASSKVKEPGAEREKVRLQNALQEAEPALREIFYDLLDRVNTQVLNDYGSSLAKRGGGKLETIKDNVINNIHKVVIELRIT